MDLSAVAKSEAELWVADIIAEYRRVTWRTTWLCAGIVAIMNTMLIVALMLTD